MVPEELARVAGSAKPSVAPKSKVAQPVEQKK
jgi:hypothetical protein